MADELLSEKAAWNSVGQEALAIARWASSRNLKEIDYIIESAHRLQWLAEKMRVQVASGFHRNPALLVGLNPPGRMRRNPLPGTSVRADEQISDRVYELAYRHAEDGLDYKHEFKAGVELWTVTMGKARCVVLSGTNGQDLWQDF